MTSTTGTGSNIKQIEFLESCDNLRCFDKDDFLKDVTELNDGLNRLVQKKNFLNDTLWSVVKIIYFALCDIKRQEFKDTGEADYLEWDPSPSMFELQDKFIMFAKMDLLNEDNQKSLLDMVSLMYCKGCIDDMNFADFCRYYYGEEEEW